MLCSYCDGITIRKLLGLYMLQKLPRKDYEDFHDDYYIHQPSFETLVESAGDGCGICQAIVDAILANRQCMAEAIKRISRNTDTQIGLHIEYSDKTAFTEEFQTFDRLKVKVGFDDTEDTSQGKKRVVLLSLTRPQFGSSTLEEYGLGEPYRGRGLRSVEHFNLAREWLRTCVSEHDDKDCPPLEERPFPTRLIDLGPLGGLDCPKLFISAGQKGLYVALSHCWGGETPLKTTTKCLEQHCQHLPCRLLPRTFADAITITRELGFRYLWIDSLCILQDSKKDWEQESAVMGDVYKNAVITIAASASRNGTIGIFDVLEEKPKYYGSLKIYPDCSPSENVEVSTFQGDETMIDALFALPLANRGWTMQERILSQRVLHYGRRRIYWQCRMAHLSADGNYPQKRIAELNSPISSLLKLPRILTRTDEASQLRHIHNIWSDVLESYCCFRELTYSSDKLPAMAGIARTFQGLTGGTYLAGIWKEDLARGLLWRALPSTRRIKGRAPSWSWASCDGELAFDTVWCQQVENTLLVQLLQYHVQLSGANPFGEVASGFLRLRAWVITQTLNEASSLGDMTLDDQSMQLNRQEESTHSVKTQHTIALIGTFLDPLNEKSNPNSNHRRRGMLVLKAVDGTLSTTYERIGTIFHDDDDDMDELQNFGWKRLEVTIV